MSIQAISSSPHSYTILFPAVSGPENENESASLQDALHAGGDNVEKIEPSECKIPKTDTGDSATEEMIDIKVVYNRNKYDVSAPATTTVAQFKKQLQTLLGIN